MFAKLERPIDFEALDGLPVDLIFLLIAPESAGADHLKALAAIARVLRNPDFAAQLRGARDASAIYSLLTLSRRRTRPDRVGDRASMKARVTVTLKPSVLDPQGKAIEGALKSLGLEGVSSVRQGKVFDIELDGVDGDAGEAG